MAVSDECKLKFQELKSKRSFRFITFKINEQTQQVVVDRLGQPGDTYDDFTGSMPESECRYAVFDLEGQEQDAVRELQGPVQEGAGGHPAGAAGHRPQRDEHGHCQGASSLKRKTRIRSRDRHACPGTTEAVCLASTGGLCMYPCAVFCTAGASVLLLHVNYSRQCSVSTAAR
ncbi:Actin-depolymerizing factor [Zea mays]|uniref:Actin-depolymerizing factor n=1 Tax=Zea mays TaxID=4577 RepID=A0A1D6E3P0_MAIZE|nr:Actin-depolymerizing factor [Zea mays]